MDLLYKLLCVWHATLWTAGDINKQFRTFRQIQNKSTTDRSNEVWELIIRITLLTRCFSASCYLLFRCQSNRLHTSDWWTLRYVSSSVRPSLAGWPLRNSATASRSSRHQSKNRPVFFARSRLVLKPLTVFAISRFHATSLAQLRL